MSQELITRCLIAVEKDLRQSVQHLSKEPSGLYDPVRYTLKKGGKRVRPVLALLGAAVTGASIAKALPAARCVEFFHNFTLLHDDIMDASALRRGKPSVYRKFGVNRAILSGDALFVLAWRCLDDYPVKVSSQLYPIFHRMALEVCEGQEMDMAFEQRNSVTLKEYEEMIRKKTAVLLGASLEMGALAGGATELTARKLYKIGVELGIIFQIMDDLLDTFGNEKMTGKKTGQDIRAGKKTWLASYVTDCLGNSRQGRSFQKMLRTGNEEKVRKVYRNLKVREAGESLCRRKTARLINTINALPLLPKGKKSLLFLQESLLTRSR
ncbi:MAG: polyprenyl synthetase family protein [Bacteroidia bacterium]|nr:polyprenyl synthetase family protein [Bacteroidia bacterium]